MLCWKQWLLVNQWSRFVASSNPELIQHGRTGFLAPAETFQKMAMFVNDLAQNPELQTTFGQRAQMHRGTIHDGASDLRTHGIDREMNKKQPLSVTIITTYNEEQHIRAA